MDTFNKELYGESRFQILSLLSEQKIESDGWSELTMWMKNEDWPVFLIQIFCGGMCKSQFIFKFAKPPFGVVLDRLDRTGPT